MRSAPIVLFILASISRLLNLEAHIRIINTVSVQARSSPVPGVRVQSNRHNFPSLLADKRPPYQALQLSVFYRIRVTSALVVLTTPSRVLQLLYPNMLSTGRLEAQSASPSLTLAIDHTVP